MANIKSSQKDVVKAEKNRQRNAAYRSRVRTAIKKVAADCAKKDLTKAEADLKEAVSVIDRSYSLGIQKQNTTNRQKTRVYRMVNELKASLASASAAE